MGRKTILRERSSGSRRRPARSPSAAGKRREGECAPPRGRPGGTRSSFFSMRTRCSSAAPSAPSSSRLPIRSSARQRLRGRQFAHLIARCQPWNTSAVSTSTAAPTPSGIALPWCLGGQRLAEDRRSRPPATFARYPRRDTDLTLTLQRLRYRIQYAPTPSRGPEAPGTIAGLESSSAGFRDHAMSLEASRPGLQPTPRRRSAGSAFGHLVLSNRCSSPSRAGRWKCSSVRSSRERPRRSGITFAPSSADLFLALLACRIEGEPLHRALTIVPMRFVYRPLLPGSFGSHHSRAQRSAGGLGKTGTHGAVPSRAEETRNDLSRSRCSCWRARSGGCATGDGLGAEAFQHPRLVVPSRASTRELYGLGEREDTVTLEGIEDFEKLAGKHQAIVASRVLG